MEINQDNPYITGFIIQYNEGDSSLERFEINHKPSVNDKLHTVRDWDNLSDLSLDYYKSSKWWWVIADVNKVFDPFDLTEHKNLVIPDLNDIRSKI
jgi:hypothetical protein